MNVCPVCSGRGIVPLGFYDGFGPYMSSAGDTTEPCRACGGTGVALEQATANAVINVGTETRLADIENRLAVLENSTNGFLGKHNPNADSILKVADDLEYVAAMCEPNAVLFQPERVRHYAARLRARAEKRAP